MTSGSKRSAWKWVLWLALLVIACVIAMTTYRQRLYPYGHRPAAMRSLYLALRIYAQDNGGRFPESDKGPYDALRKLYPEYCPSGVELAGVSGNIDATVAALQKGKPLDESLTSWIYQPGLKETDDPRIAILWESKTGVFASGRRTRGPSRPVLLLDGEITNVIESVWSDFLKEQERLRKAAQAEHAAQTNSP